MRDVLAAVALPVGGQLVCGNGGQDGGLQIGARLELCPCLLGGGLGLFQRIGRPELGEPGSNPLGGYGGMLLLFTLFFIFIFSSVTLRDIA